MRDQASVSYVLCILDTCHTRRHKVTRMVFIYGGVCILEHMYGMVSHVVRTVVHLDTSAQSPRSARALSTALTQSACTDCMRILEQVHPVCGRFLNRLYLLWMYTCNTCHTHAGTKSKINNCIIMEGVRIGENCTIQNSIICANASIGESCNLNDCQIGALYEVAAGTKAKGETFTRTVQGF